ncbi:hypothetical protein ABH922_000570 [Rhodococcus sp. 27YEA15]
MKVRNVRAGAEVAQRYRTAVWSACTPEIRFVTTVRDRRWYFWSLHRCVREVVTPSDRSMSEESITRRASRSAEMWNTFAEFTKDYDLIISPALSVACPAARSAPDRLLGRSLAKQILGRLRCARSTCSTTRLSPVRPGSVTTVYPSDCGSPVRRRQRRQSRGRRPASRKRSRVRSGPDAGVQWCWPVTVRGCVSPLGRSGSGGPGEPGQGCAAALM